MTPSNTDQIIKRAEAAIRSNLRQASIAEVSGFRTPDRDVYSSFGGKFVGRKGEAWPEYKGRPLLPILKIVVDELPYCHPDLQDFKLVQVYVSEDFMPEDQVSGDGWLLKTYTDLDGLYPIDSPLNCKLLAFPIKWIHSTNEAPCWEDLGAVMSYDLASKYALIEREGPDFYDLFENASATKIGGFPSWIQGGVRGPDVIIQIETEEKARWHWPASGCAYIHKDSNWGWVINCEFT